MSQRTARYIIKPRVLEQLSHHDLEKVSGQIGVGYKYMGSDLVPGADMTVLIREITNVPPDLPSYVYPHTHEVSSLYCIVGPLTMELILDGERHEVTGPASIFIPAGMEHHAHVLRGEGHFIMVMNTGDYK